MFFYNKYIKTAAKIEEKDVDYDTSTGQLFQQDDRGTDAVRPGDGD